MNRFRPSLAQLAILGSIVLMVPPTLAIGTATVQLEQLASDSERTVRRAAREIEHSRALSEHAQAMERYALQFDALQDPRFDELYRDRRAKFRATAERLTPVVAVLDQGMLARLLEEEQAVHEQLLDPATEDRRAALDRLAGITVASRERFDRAADAVANSTRDIATATAQMQRDLLRLAAVLVPLLGIAVLVLIGVLIRPIRRLESAIRGLGGGDLDHPIEVGGTDDLRQLGERLEWLRQRLLAVETDRVRLFRHVSHELKTPLACIREGTELLADGVPDPPTAAQTELLTILRSNAHELQARIEDILEVSAIRQGDTELQREPVDLGELVRTGMERHRVQARALNLVLDLETPAAPVLADRHKLATTIDNLLSNALKFSPAGGTLSAIVSPGRTNHQLTVTDEGPGIPESDHERVFEAFYRGQGAIGVPGTGLGLSIAREYARAHGGDVVVASGQPRGTRLVLTLPTEPA